MKKLLPSLLGLSVLFLAGCSGSSDEEKLATLAADVLCFAKDSTQEIMTLVADPKAMEEKGKEFEEKLNNMLKEAGYENEEALEAAYEKVEDKEKLKTMIQEKAEAKCAPEEQMMQGFLEAMEEGDE